MPLPTRRGRAQGAYRATRQSSQRDDQLARAPAIAQRGNRFGGAFEGEGRADLRRDLALGPPAEQLVDVRSIAPGLARGERAPKDAADVAALEQGEVERELRDARGKADDEGTT